MHFSLPNTLLLAVALHTGVNAASDDKKIVEPCTVAGPTGNFYDLTALRVAPPVEGVKPGKNEKTEDWHSKGWDYHDGQANFTLNICAPVVAEVDDVVGVEKSLWKNVSAHYTLGSKTYSIGSNSSSLILRGRRLVLQYTGGSPCGGASKRSISDDEPKPRTKSTIISFHCDKDPLATPASGSATFVGTDPDECSYHFEVLSTAACISAEPAKQGVGPAAVFAIIGVIAILVYFLGGVFYQRNVAHARGWRQLPNYSMWAGIGSFIKVSLYTVVQRVRQMVFPRVASVRDGMGILPTMEVRSSSVGGKKWNRGHGQYTSRTSWDSTHLS